jgi:hypothetical protein
MSDDPIDTLARVTGLTNPEVAKVFAEVKLNRQRLDACKLHAFAPTRDLRGRVHYKCSACGGTIDASAYHWYCCGRTHAAMAAAGPLLR